MLILRIFANISQGLAQRWQSFLLIPFTHLHIIKLQHLVGKHGRSRPRADGIGYQLISKCLVKGFKMHDLVKIYQNAASFGLPEY